MLDISATNKSCKIYLLSVNYQAAAPSSACNNIGCTQVLPESRVVNVFVMLCQVNKKSS